MFNWQIFIYNAWLDLLDSYYCVKKFNSKLKEHYRRGKVRYGIKSIIKQSHLN